MHPLSIAIAGCGPGGLAAALLLHRDGHRVQLFERFDAPRPVGSGLMIQPTGRAVLRELGLDRMLIACSARIERLFGQADGRTVLDVRYRALRGDAFGLGTHRATLFELLFNAVRAAGIPMQTNRTIVSSALHGDGQRGLTFSDGDRAGPFDLVVDTLGTNTPLAPPTGRLLTYGALWANLDWPADTGFDAARLEQRYDRASTMAGVLPIGTPSGSQRPQAAFFWSIRADRFEAWRTGGLAPWKAEVAALWSALPPFLDQIVDPMQLTFARYAHRTLARSVEPAMIHLGDAWHSASPQLGQGANMALLDAYALAVALRRSERLADALSLAAKLRAGHVRLYQAMSTLFTPFYQSDSRLLPLARDQLVGPIARLWPATRVLASMVSGLFGDPLRPLGLSA